MQKTISEELKFKNNMIIEVEISEILVNRIKREVKILD